MTGAELCLRKRALFRPDSDADLARSCKKVLERTECPRAPTGPRTAAALASQAWRRTSSVARGLGRGRHASQSGGGPPRSHLPSVRKGPCQVEVQPATAAPCASCALAAGGGTQRTGAHAALAPQTAQGPRARSGGQLSAWGSREALRRASASVAHSRNGDARPPNEAHKHAGTNEWSTNADAGCTGLPAWPTPRAQASAPSAQRWRTQHEQSLGAPGSGRACCAQAA